MLTRDHVFAAHFHMQFNCNKFNFISDCDNAIIFRIIYHIIPHALLNNNLPGFIRVEIGENFTRPYKEAGLIFITAEQSQKSAKLLSRRKKKSDKIKTHFVHLNVWFIGIWCCSNVRSYEQKKKTFVFKNLSMPNGWKGFPLQLFIGTITVLM